MSKWVLGRTLAKKLPDAILNREKQRRAFEEFTATLPDHQVADWARQLAEWEKDPEANPSPFQEPPDGK